MVVAELPLWPLLLEGKDIESAKGIAGQKAVLHAQVSPMSQCFNVVT